MVVLIIFSIIFKFHLSKILFLLTDELRIRILRRLYLRIVISLVLRLELRVEVRVLRRWHRAILVSNKVIRRSLGGFLEMSLFKLTKIKSVHGTRLFLG